MSQALRSYFHPTTPTTVECSVVHSASMESYLKALQSELPHFHLRTTNLTVAVESQQQDEALKEKIKDEIQEEIKLSLDSPPTNGPLQMFLLDGRAVANGDAGAQATLRALARASFDSPANVVAAILPPLEGEEQEGTKELPEAIQNVIDEFLVGNGVRSFATLEGLLQHLRSMV